VFGLKPDSVTQAFDRACQRAGLAGLHFHDLRHEATSRLADLLQAHELAKVTGHKDMRMVLRYYHPHASDLAKKLG
jgi:integrase